MVKNDLAKHGASWATRPISPQDWKTQNPITHPSDFERDSEFRTPSQNSHTDQSTSHAIYPPIPNPGCGDDQSRLGWIRCEIPARFTGRHARVLHVGLLRHTPDRSEDHPMRRHPSCGLHNRRLEPELHRTHPDRVSFAPAASPASLRSTRRASRTSIRQTKASATVRSAPTRWLQTAFLSTAQSQVLKTRRYLVDVCAIGVYLSSCAHPAARIRDGRCSRRET